MEFLKSLFEKAENGALTYEQFVEAVNGSGIKIGNLTNGDYVSKSKYDDEVGELNGQIQTLNGTISTRDTDLANLQKTLNEAGNLDELKNASAELKKLQAKYDKETKDNQAKLSKQAYEFAVREFANGQKFSSKAAKRDFVNEMLSKNLTMEDGQIIGASDFVTAYSQENEDAFVVEQPSQPIEQPAEPSNKPMFVAPTSSGNQTPDDPTGGFGTAFHFTEIHPRQDS